MLTLNILSIYWNYLSSDIINFVSQAKRVPSIYHFLYSSFAVNVLFEFKSIKLKSYNDFSHMLESCNQFQLYVCMLIIIILIKNPPPRRMFRNHSDFLDKCACLCVCVSFPDFICVHVVSSIFTTDLPMNRLLIFDLYMLGLINRNLNSIICVYSSFYSYLHYFGSDFICLSFKPAKYLHLNWQVCPFKRCEATIILHYGVCWKCF